MAFDFTAHTGKSSAYATSETNGYICSDVTTGAVWYIGRDGGLYRASKGTCLDLDGYAQGRYDMPSHYVNQQLTLLRKAAPHMSDEIDAYLASQGVEFQTSFAA